MFEMMSQMKHLLTIVFLCLVQLAQPAVFINELMSRNASYKMNELFNFAGWVELYNAGSESVELSHLVFSDGKKSWQCKAEEQLAPNSYVLVYFDELDKGAHASFKLDADGGVLRLLSTDGVELDVVIYPKGFRNTSYGRAEDGGSEMGTLGAPTPNASNNVDGFVKKQTVAPEFDLAPGFYKGEQIIGITALADSATIYYTLDGSEPQAGLSPIYEEPITVSKNTPLRAIAVEDGKLKSDITTATYFIDERDISLPVVSLVTDHKYFYDDSIGMLVVGVNGAAIPKDWNPPSPKANYMRRDWDRPCNFEYFSAKDKSQLVGIEVKVSVGGGYSRLNARKTIIVNASKVYGGNRLVAHLFRKKPNLQWKGLLLRNSGNDFGSTHIRDGVLHSVVEGQMDIDYQAFEPSVVFINGLYYGFLSTRERSSKDFIYSNYCLDEDEFTTVGFSPSATNEYYKDVLSLSGSANMNEEGIYEKFDSLIDVNEFLNYFMTEIYVANTDWHNNSKAWKRIENGKWRWILYDTDLGFNLAGKTDYNTFLVAEKNSTYKSFIKNKRLRDRLISKFSVHLATTFKPERVVHILDSISSYVESEALYFHQKVIGKDSSHWYKQVQSMRNFANQRPDSLFGIISRHFALGDTAAIRICSDIPGTRYTFNEEPVKVSDLQTKFYNGLDVNIKAVVPDGYRFKHWEISGDSIVDSLLVDTSVMLTTTFLGATSYKAIFETDSTYSTELPKLYLNEICATNKQYVDEYFQSDDWIEIYNDGSSPVDIGGMYISDARNNPQKYQIADSMPQLTTIPAGGYLALWADGETEQGVLHTNFKLSNTKQQTVSLSKMVNGDLVVIDSIRYQLHAKGEAFARFSCGEEGDWKLTSLPTFMAENKFAPRLAKNVVLEEDSIIITTDSDILSDGVASVIYPNPATDVLYFNLPWENAEVYFSDGLKVVRHLSVTNGGGVDVKNMPAGFYLVIIRNRDTREELVQKFIKL